MFTTKSLKYLNVNFFVIFFFLLGICRAAETGRQKIIEMLLDNENGKNLIPKTDVYWRNVFHYPVKSPTVLKYLISHPVTVGN